MTKVNQRQRFVERVIPFLEIPEEFTSEQALKTWFYNIRSNGGWRLTDTGLLALRLAKLESYEVVIDTLSKQDVKQFMLDLDHKLLTPYYINLKTAKLTMFGSRDAMMARLYGNITAWLNSYESRASSDPTDS